MINLSYGSGEVSLDNNISIVAIQIQFKGVVKINQTLPKEFTIYNSKNKIIIYSMSLNVLPDLLFTYNGNFRILSCIASNNKGEKIDITITNDNLGFWQKQNTTWETGIGWESLDGNYIVGQIPVVQKKNLPELTEEQKKLQEELRKG
tara:strand:- start:314 stop:757 length:444 start_codon:yes stop_codon:yes gene_type:complete